MRLSQLTETELQDRVKQVVLDVAGKDKVDLALADKFTRPDASDTVRFPNDPINQEIYETIILGATLQDAFDDDLEYAVKGKILIMFLALVGVRIDFTPERN